MTTDQEILDIITGVWNLSRIRCWYEREAALAIKRGHYRLIHGRTDNDVYVVRCWLSAPVLKTASKEDEDDFDSGDSLLLHYFPRADDDACLHDHPWDFETTILGGSYREHLPLLDWAPGSRLGPAWDERHIWHGRGDTVRHHAEDLHCVGMVAANTWTLLRTGPRRRPWGFHPPGQVWQPWRQYINGLKLHEALSKGTIINDGGSSYQ